MIKMRLKNDSSYLNVDMCIDHENKKIKIQVNMGDEKLLKALEENGARAYELECEACIENQYKDKISYDRVLLHLNNGSEPILINNMHNLKKEQQ